MKLVTSMNADKAKRFFLKSKNYFTFDLPKYFNFEKIINLSNSLITGKNFIEDIVNDKNNLPKKIENIDYILMHNKNGKYDWRPFELIHPILYVKLVNDICETNNWKKIKKRFKEFQKNKKIVCCSIPCDSEKNRNVKSENVSKWWNEYEQRSISLALDYSLMANTDITNCYASIYTHTISWAIHTKPIAKKNTDNSLIGNLIDTDIRQMRYGQTSGIPQGSVLMDFIAEIVLGYCDEILTTKLNELGICDYQILRYRDDYRIFSNNSLDIERILKSLAESLLEVNLKLNPSKTYTTTDVVLKSIKDDKITRLISQESMKNLSMQKQLLIIDKFGMNYPNSGSLDVLLDNVYRNKIQKLKNKPNSYDQVISITTDIMYNNPRTYPICVAIISNILNYLEKKQAGNYIDKIYKKFEKLPNTDYLEIWLQRMTVTYDRGRAYKKNSICNKIYDNSVKIWNSDWLKNEVKEKFKEEIIDEKELENMQFNISVDEVNEFSVRYN